MRGSWRRWLSRSPSRSGDDTRSGRLRRTWRQCPRRTRAVSPEGVRDRDADGHLFGSRGPHAPDYRADAAAECPTDGAASSAVRDREDAAERSTRLAREELGLRAGVPVRAREPLVLRFGAVRREVADLADLIDASLRGGSQDVVRAVD